MGYERKNAGVNVFHHWKHLFFILFILWAAFGLRVSAFTNNTRAYGDVNTIRISAQQAVTTGVLQYPWRIDRYEDKLGDPLASPAYQHAPAYPFTAAILARLLGTIDTFFALKLITLFVGMMVVAVGYRLTARYFSPSTGIIAALWLATSPALIDFSGNGSPYSLSALALLIFSVQLTGFRFTFAQTALLAMTCSISFQFHPAMLAMTVCTIIYGLISLRKLSPTHILIFFGVWLLCYAPSARWYLTYYDKPFISGQLYFVAGELGLSDGQRSAILDNPFLLITPPVSARYMDAIRIRAEVYLANVMFELGAPMLIFALMAGIVGLLDRTRPLIHLIAPRLIYLGLTAAAISLFHMRFLVPVLPALLIMAAYGAEQVRQTGRLGRIVMTCCILAYAVSAVWGYATADTPPARYYRNESVINAEYDAARDITEQLHPYPAATIAGCADARMVLYNTSFRLEVTGCQPSIQRIEELQRYPDLHLRYLLYRKPVIVALYPYFPNARIIAQNELFAVLDLLPDPE